MRSLLCDVEAVMVTEFSERRAFWTNPAGKDFSRARSWGAVRAGATIST